PMRPSVTKARDASRSADAFSPKRLMPTSAEPAAPMPVQMAYAVPIGIVSSAAYRQDTLPAPAPMLSYKVHQGRALAETAHTISSKLPSRICCPPDTPAMETPAVLDCRAVVYRGKECGERKLSDASRLRRVV